jgi:3-carboxy-cis,cis-muconate cycloisomerase
VGYAVLPLVHQLAKVCTGDAGQYAHWGATTQDIWDSATILQMREAFLLVEADLAALAAILADLASRYRDAVMPGRTHLQHALPITFGYKAAVWLSSIDRHIERLCQMRPRLLVGQFAGAAGTLASLHPNGLKVSDALMVELGLGVASMPWHVARDGIAEALNLLGLVTGTLSKIATDIMLMMASEAGEAFEPFVKGRGGSSTMPQKRNPISCELILACGKLVRQHAALAMDAMVADFERATGPWHVEWIVVPEAFVLAAGALAQARFMLAGLEVDTERMRRNLDITSGLIVAEAVMMGLAPKLGRGVAHDIVYDACRKAGAERVSLLEALRATPAIRDKLADAELVRLTDPANYVGHAGDMVDRMLKVAKTRG